jgi:hypothetical protein
MSFKAAGALTKPLTMILLSPDVGAGPPDMGFEALLACRVDFLTPPTGAADAVPFALGFEPRRTLRRELRWVLRISSSDLSSLPDMMTGVVGERRGWEMKRREKSLSGWVSGLMGKPRRMGSFD